MNIIHKPFYFYVAVLLLTFIGCRGKTCGGDDETVIRCCGEEKSEECCEKYPESQCCETVAPPVEEAKIDSINFYLENSHSMGGYFQTKTNFYSDIDGLLTDMMMNDKFPEKVNTYTIAETRSEFKSVTDFRNQLDPTNKSKIAIAKSSPLNTIISNICSMATENSVNLFVTDGIPSGSNTKLAKYDNTKKGKYYNLDFTDKLMNDIKVTLNQNCNDFAIQVLAMKSNFSSTYKHPYFKLDNNKTNGKQIGEFTQRPYYIFIFGKSELIKDFMKKCGDSFEAEESLTVGFDYPENLEPTGIYVKGGADCRVSGKKVVFTKNATDSYKFGVLANFSAYPDALKSKEYLEQNVKIYNGGEMINTVVTMNSLKDNLKGIIQNGTKARNMTQDFTHLIEIELPDYTPTLSDKLEMKILRKTPQWYQNWSADSDLNITLDDDKTYGFKYVIDGILAAKNEDKESFLYTAEIEYEIK